MSNMSVITSFTGKSSILKSPLVNRNRPTSNRVRFQYPKTEKIRNILVNFLNHKNIRQYEELVCSIRDTDLKDDDIQLILEESRDCISLLGHDFRLFVEAVLSLDWVNRGPNIAANYHTFLLDLLTAHNYHTELTMEKLVKHFLHDDNWTDGKPSDESVQVFTSIHNVIDKILYIIPMSGEILIEAIISSYPYYKREVNLHISYLHNLLWILSYRPALRQDIFLLVINRLIVLDVNAPKVDIEEQEMLSSDEETENQFYMETDEIITNNGTNALMKHSVANTLDKCMVILLQHIRQECFIDSELDNKKTEKMYKDLIVVFEKVILPTHAIYHVQFIMFYLCSFKVVFVEAFLNLLWHKVTDPNVAPVHRQVAVCYIASLLARAQFIPMGMLRAMMVELCTWLHSYVSRQDGINSNASLSDNKNISKGGVNAHRVFYSVAQGLFYIIAFRHKDLTASKKNLVFLQSLNLAKLVTCPLNPLRFCLPTVVQNFAAVTRAEQLAYCYTVIERNDRNNMAILYGEQHQLVKTNESLETFFPFDPYILKSSSEFIEPIYLQYRSSLSTSQLEPPAASSSANLDEDDFIHESQLLTSLEIASCSYHQRSTKLDKFSYGTSPGFKQS